MPTLNRPFGFAAYRSLSQATHNAATNRYCIPSTDGSSFFIGDPVIQAAGADTFGVPNVQKAVSGASTALRGIIVGVENPTVGAASLQGTVVDDSITSIPATKTRAYYVYVVDDPQALFMIQDDGITGANLVAASASLNSAFTVTAPTLGYQLSATVLLSSSILGTNTLPLKLMGLAQIPNLPGNVVNSFGTFAVWVTKINVHNLLAGPGQAGI